MTLTLTVAIEEWPLAETFIIARGAKTAAHVVVVTLTSASGLIGRGECVPYARYGETTQSVCAQIATIARAFAQDAATDIQAHRTCLQSQLPAGAARNAIDCALWDLEAKLTRSTVATLIGAALPHPTQSMVTAYTLSLDTPEAMAAKARAVAHLPLLKLKLGGHGDAERMTAVRAARPDARIIVDANESWPTDALASFFHTALETRVELIEQPLPAGHDAALAHRPPGVAVCADESVHTRSGLADLATHYDAINIKLDKAGGLTEALALAKSAQALGLDIMVGCMVATSLAMAPALLLAPYARWVDLDGPLLLVRDRDPGIAITNGVISPASPALWG